MRTYGTNEGLPSAHIAHITRDSRGFLWFSTRDGLSRFDGSRFVSYGMEEGLSVPTVNFLLESRRGGYWIATNGGGICRLDPEAKRRLGGDPLLRCFPVGSAGANKVNVLLEDRAGRLWLGSDSGLYCLERAAGEQALRAVDLGARHSLGIHALAESSEGDLWVGSGELGLIRILPDGRTFRYPLRPTAAAVDPVWSIIQDGEGRLWVGHEAGLLVFRPETASKLIPAGQATVRRSLAYRRPIDASEVRLPAAPGEARWFGAADGLPDDRIRDVAQTSDGHLWIGTAGGLAEFDGQRFHSYRSTEGLTDGSVDVLAEDREGNLWMATLQGAMKLIRSGFVTFDEPDGPGHSDVAGIFEDAEGRIFVVSWPWTLSRFDGARFVSARPRPPGAQTAWAAQLAFLDRSGGWWLLAERGLGLFPRVRRIEDIHDRPPVVVYTKRDGLAGSIPVRLFEDARGDIWVGAGEPRGRGGLSRWERASGRFQQYPDARGLVTGDRVSALGEDGSGAVWVGFHEAGLFRQRRGRFEPVGTAEGAPRGMITALHRDDAGRLWIGSNRDGLTRVDDASGERPRFVRYTTATGLASNNVRCIASDGAGRIYAGTVRGVDRLDARTGAVRHYTTADGLANDFVTTILRDRSGRLWFGTMRGQSRLLPEPERVPAPPSVWIDGLRVAGVPHPVSHLGQSSVLGLVLRPGQNHVEIDFSGLGFVPGGAPRYQHMLEGVDRDWGRPTPERAVHYSRLAPGRYRFAVRAVDADGLASPMPARVDFTVLPPFWQRGFFQALVAVALGLLAYAAHRYRVGRLLALERVRTRIAADLHDDLGSSLSQIAILSEVVGRRLEGRDPVVRAPLERIAGLSRDSVDSMSDIVWAIDPGKDRLTSLAQRMRRFANELLQARDIRLDFAPDAAGQDLSLGADVRRNVFLVFKESLNNAVRHSGCRAVEVALHVRAGHLTLRVSDDGRGFDPARTGDGHGLESMRRRAASMGRTLELISREGAGTAVTLTVPLRAPRGQV